MKIEFNYKKNLKNKYDPSRGFGFERAEMIDWETAVTLEDTRRDYGERRYITYGMIGERLHVLVWTPRGRKRRVISLRKANRRERSLYEEEIH